MINILHFIIIGLFCYLVGSIPTAYIIVKLLKGIDIRNYGSGNPGATNVFRVVGKTAGIGTLIFDFLKSFIPIMLIKTNYPEFTALVILCSVLTIIGHNWSVFINFRGGKGVATGAGVAFAIIPQVALIGTIVFIIVLTLTRTVSLSSIVSIAAVIITCWLINKQLEINFFITFTGILVIFRHKTNIKRLLEIRKLKINK